ncbi:cell wall protein DAN4-like, partial [Clarias magur]
VLNSTMGRNLVLATLCLIAACATADTSDNQTAVNTSVTNTALTNTSSTPNTTTGTAPVVRTFIVVFNVTESFPAALANTSSPQFTAKAKSVCTLVEPSYRKSYKNFLKMNVFNF